MKKLIKTFIGGILIALVTLCVNSIEADAAATKINLTEISRPNDIESNIAAMKGVIASHEERNITQTYSFMMIPIHLSIKSFRLMNSL